MWETLKGLLRKQSPLDKVIQDEIGLIIKAVSSQVTLNFQNDLIHAHQFSSDFTATATNADNNGFYYCISVRGKDIFKEGGYIVIGYQDISTSSSMTITGSYKHSISTDQFELEWKVFAEKMSTNALMRAQGIIAPQLKYITGFVEGWLGEMRKTEALPDTEKPKDNVVVFKPLENKP